MNRSVTWYNVEYSLTTIGWVNSDDSFNILSVAKEKDGSILIRLLPVPKEEEKSEATEE